MLKGILKCSAVALLAMLAGCRNAGDCPPDTLEGQLYRIVNNAPGTVGIAFVSAGDTVLVNNGARYAMMSVFKLHESLAVCDALERNGATLDTALHVTASELDRNTWSPMLKEYGETDFCITAGELVRYSLVSSDNNASNILFSRVVSPSETERFMKSVAADTSFAIRYSEAQMKREHNLSYCNYSSPLSACLLIRQVFTSEIVPEPYLDAVRSALATVTTGHDRLGAAIAGEEGVLFAHKTGSGYRNSCGELMAFNDVAYFRLPDGRDYGLAVMIRDFSGSEEDAAGIMACISKAVRAYVSR